MKPIGVLPGGSFALGIPSSDSVNRAVFSAAGSTAREITVPTTLGASAVFFSADCNFTAAYSTATGTNTAVYGSSAVDNGIAHELNPTVRQWPKGSIAFISVISPTSGIVTAAFYNQGST